MKTRFRVIFFVDQKGSNPVFEYMINDKNVKDMEVIINEIGRLYRNGLVLIETNSLKRIGKDLFEIRKDRHRILFAQNDPDCFILLHAFLKETKNTPIKHLCQARQNFIEYKKNRNCWVPKIAFNEY